MTPRPLRSTAPAPAWRDETVATAGAAPLRLRLYGAPQRGADQALVLHFHAGAFVGGRLDDGAAVAGVLVDAGAVVASLDYPLAPAHPFPQAVEAGHAALQWLDRQRRRLGLPNAPLYVAGEEAGGNLAAAVAMAARDRDGPGLAGQILLSPMLDVCVATASQRDAKAGPVGCRWADGWRAYLARDTDAVHPYATPGASLRLAGLPPALLISAADDPLRDETQAFARRLREAGVPVTLTLLEQATGWPNSYLQADLRAKPRPWTAALGAPVQAFFEPSNTFQGSTP